jgi:capsid protein
MLSYLWNKYQVARLSARYQRLVQERLLSLAESAGPSAVVEDHDAGDWTLLGAGQSSISEHDRLDARARARQLVAHNPHARNVLRLLEVYVVGPGLKVEAVHRKQANTAAAGRTVARANALWNEFLRANRPHWSYREFARRAWRDGEVFVRKFAGPAWPPTVRFIDAEAIGDPTHLAGNKGIVTDPDDVETPIAYLHIDPASGTLLEEIPADLVLHTKTGVDSNQKRGVTIFLPVLDVLKRFEGWMETELIARKLQASIVLWRKVRGSSLQAAALGDAARTGTSTSADGPVNREKIKSGTILTTPAGTELEFLSPNTNFSDAVPLGRLILLCIAAGQGLPEFMLTSDASNANFASTMVAEAPAVKLFRAEQQFFIAEFDALWRWVMGEAVGMRLLPARFFDDFTSTWTAPDVVTRDRAKERQADVSLLRAGVLSRHEVARRDGVDPSVMEAERNAEAS